MKLKATILANRILQRLMFTSAVFTAVFCILAIESDQISAQEGVKLNQGDHICYIGNTMADRMQHHAWLETYITKLHPNHDLVFRNLGFSADEVKLRPRSMNFGDPNQWLTKCEADVVFCFFGYNESLKGPAGLKGFETDLADMIDEMRGRKYNGKSAPRLVFFSPVAHENLKSPNLPDGAENNANLKLYSEAMQKVCESKGVPYFDLFYLSGELYQRTANPLTMNGIHLLDEGNKLVAKAVIPKLFPGKTVPAADSVKETREAILDKNYHWFSRHRVVDGYNVYGGRSKLAWFDQSNADVMLREMEMFDIMTANRDKKVWAVAKGSQFELRDDNLPEELIVQRNKVGPLEGGAWPYLSGEGAIEKMTVHQNMNVNLFASEEMFPRLINPVQVAVDTDSRLFVACWESYPHWNPTQPRKDCIMILPDEDGDGVADECKIFADELNSITGFEFWGGGILVAAPPEIWFLKDTDGDDVADYKLRMLQGISSADTHHSANAMLVGPDGWLYFSRGIFNVANFETPTKTFRSGQSGVHRFNPRTFEFEFHFPIGPNPHGDSIDRWGYQFANDGTGGTGSYINIGKGVGNKQWFKKRVRPVPANGILSSSHFPPENDGNFLISNAIGFLGVLQHTVAYDGADIKATEVEPIVFSDDPNFRPSDMEVGGDGALYIADWHNALIGHMQHNMRDPNRDHTHGRIYRVTYEGRPLIKPAKMKNKPVNEVCQNFFARENGTRYRARLELSGRETDQVLAEVAEFASTLNPGNAGYERDEAQALLECLWVFEEHRVANFELIARVFEAKEPKVRAAAIRTLGHWAGKVAGWEPLLGAAAKDDSALVRAEAVKSAVDLGGLASAEAIFTANSLPLDDEMETVLNYAKAQLNIGSMIKQMLASGEALSPAANAYVLATGNPGDLAKLPASEPVYRAILSRKTATQTQLDSALTGLAESVGTPKTKLLIDMISQDQSKRDNNVIGLGELLASQPIGDLNLIRKEVEDLAVNGATPEVKRLGYATWVAAAGPDDAFLAATQSKKQLQDFLDAVPTVNEEARGALFDRVMPLIFEMPSNVGEEGAVAARQNGVSAGYSEPHGADAKSETLDARNPGSWTVIPNFRIMVPEGRTRDEFFNIFKSSIDIPKEGKYTFFTTSDDGSRLYIDGKEVVNNDGPHGMLEKSGQVNLTAGLHSIRVNYYDSGGGDGLNVYWTGPGIKKQTIPDELLFVAGEDSMHEVAIRALSSIPGRDAEKFTALSSLVAAGKYQETAIEALCKIPVRAWDKAGTKPLVNNIIGYLSSLPASRRTSGSATKASELARMLGGTLSDSDKTDVENRLGNLDVRVIAIGTVPHRMIYDKELIVVEAGKPAEFRFSNTDSMPHNFAITIPGALAEIGEMAEATGRDADASARHYIPKSDKVLVGSRLLQPGEEEAISFVAPTEPGIYPYVCTYPGHWRRMYGALYVVPSFERYQSDPSYLTELALPIKDDLLARNSRGQQWKYDDLIGDMKMLMGRSHEVGKASFKAANCIACHKFSGEGQNFGPDLAELNDAKQTTAHILRSIVEPSKDIDEKFSSSTFLMFDGKTMTGMVMEENNDEVKIIIDPLAKDKLTILKKDDIDDRTKSKLSPMPLGMVDKLSREEIMDLVAYIISKGDMKHKVFEGGHAHK